MSLVDEYIYDLSDSARLRTVDGPWSPNSFTLDFRLELDYRLISGTSNTRVVGRMYLRRGEGKSTLVDNANRLTWTSDVIGSGVLDNIQLSVPAGQRQELHSFDVEVGNGTLPPGDNVSIRIDGVGAGAGIHATLAARIELPQVFSGDANLRVTAARTGDDVTLDLLNSSNKSMISSGIYPIIRWEMRRRTVAGDPESPWGLWQQANMEPLSYGRVALVEEGYDYQFAAVVEELRVSSSRYPYYLRYHSSPVRMYAWPNAPEIQPLPVFLSTQKARFEWVYVTGDGSAQTGAEVTYNLVDDPAQTTISVTGEQQWAETAAPLPRGEYVVSIITKGAAVGWSNPATATFTVVQPPTVSVISPSSGDTLITNRLNLTLGWQDVQGAAMVAWQRKLLRDGEVIEQASGSGSVQYVLFDTILDNHSTYTAEVVGISGTGAPSAPATVTISTAFRPPLPPSLTAVWDEDAGVVRLTAQHATEPGLDEETDPAAAGRLERSDDDGATWVPVPTAGVLPTTANDFTAPLNALPLYRAVSATAIGVEAASAPVTVATPSQDVWLTGRDGTMARVRLDIDLEPTWGHDLAMEDYGREDRVAHFGRGLPLDVSVSGRLIAGYGLSTRWQHFLRQHVYYRDPTGNAFWAALDSISKPQAVSRLAGLSFTAHRVAGRD